jgi:Spy/CpxP family protein refolding chaperone
MNRLPILLPLALALVAMAVAPALAAGPQGQPGKQTDLERYGGTPYYGSGGPTGGWGHHGRGMGRGMGPGMMGPGMMGPDFRGWQQMSDDQRADFRKRHAKFLAETVDLRKDLASKMVELRTEWAQPDPDAKKVEKLSGQVADLKAELSKKQDKYLLSCRRAYGDRGWVCPGGGGYGGGMAPGYR